MKKLTITFATFLFCLNIDATCIDLQTSFKPLSVPGIIEAEDFDLGCPEDAYSDKDDANNGGVYRTTGVDIQATTDVDGGFEINKIYAGEWLEYTTNVASSGNYLFIFRLASIGENQFHLEVDGVDKTGPIIVPNTGKLNIWTNINSTLNLSAGKHVLRLVIDKAAENLCFNKITVESADVGWNFDVSTENWVLTNNLSSNYSSGNLRLVINGVDPYMHSPVNLNISTTDHKQILVGMKNNTTGTYGSIYFTTDLNPTFSEDKRVDFTVVANDTQYREYSIQMSNNAKWTGVLKQIRFDPLGSATTGSIDLDYIKIIGPGCNPQYITFPKVGKKLVSDAPFILTATASSGLTVDYKIVSGPASLNGNTVTLTGKYGIVNISAKQLGSTKYCPAAEVISSFYVSDPALTNTNSDSRDYVDNWVATDGLNRQLPSYSEVGAKRNDKLVGVFYYVWHGYHGDKVYDITNIIGKNPDNPLDASNKDWGPASAFHFWGEPENGYFRADDPWVIRRDLQMMSNAKVDFIFFDVTNAVTYLETIKTLCNISLQMRAEGIQTPQIAFLTYTKSGVVMNLLYDVFYEQSLFEDLWFKWNGKPLIMGDFNDTALRPEVKDFFTIKYSWSSTKSATEANHWQWLDSYPQDFGWSIDPTVPEQITVSVAEHPGILCGNSFHNKIQPPVNNRYVTDFTGQGLHIAEQWNRALAVDPSVVMITQWNEWVAQRFIWDKGVGTYAGRPIKDGDTYFVDVFTEEFNRDMAPMKGGHTDNYYYQMMANIRKFKGMSAPQAFSSPVTISVDGDFSEWNTITPIFKDPVGDVMHRNFKGYDPTVMYVNNSGRNDIIESKSTYDNNNLYFYVKTVNSITPSTDPNWMMLFIDTDRNKGTGWEGYDYVVNQSVTNATQTTLKQWDGTNWVNAKEVSYRVSVNEMELSIPRGDVLLDKAQPEFYFHWADNPQQLKDITAFFTDGESAPDRRFNYDFSTTKPLVQDQSAYKDQVIPGTIESEDFDNGGVGVAYADANVGNSGGAYRPNESVDIEPKSGGGFNVGYANTNEWLEYTVDVKAVGIYTATIHYAATNNNNEAMIFSNDINKSGVISFPATGSLQTWATKDIDIQLSSGMQVIKFFVKNATNSISFDKIEFKDKNIAYSGIGTGLLKTYYSAAVAGKPWFKDSIFSEVAPVIDNVWEDVSPGFGINKDFWNIRWRGEIEPLFSEDYTFYLTVNDMGRVWIDNILVVDGWVAASSGKTIVGITALKAGKKIPIRVDFSEKIGSAFVKLEWSSATNPREVVPQSQLFPFNASSGISSIMKPRFGIYPNPAKNSLTIYNEGVRIDKIQIYDLQGRIVYTNNNQFIGSKTILFSLAKGIYLIDFFGNASFGRQKLIIE